MFLSENVKTLRRLDDELFRAQRALARAEDDSNTFQSRHAFDLVLDCRGLVAHIEKEIASIRRVIDEEARADQIIGSAETYYAIAYHAHADAERELSRALRDVAASRNMLSASKTSNNRQMVADNLASAAVAKRRFRATRRELSVSKAYLDEVRRGFHHSY